MQTITQEMLPLSGSARRDIGMQKAIDHAEYASPGWQTRATEFFHDFLKAQGSVPFQTEYFRAWAYSRGLDRPPSERAFGGIIRKAAKQNLIVKARPAEPVSNPNANGALASVWKAA